MPSSSCAVASSLLLPQSEMSPAPTNTTLPPVVPDVTVIAAIPLLVSDVAVMVADPAAFPETSPLVLTVATPALLVVQVIVRPLSGLRPASLGVAVSCTVAFTAMVAEDGVTSTDATGTVVPLVIVTWVVSATGCPFLRTTAVAITWAVPADAGAVYIPSGLMVPLVAVYVGVRSTLSPLAVNPYAWNWSVPVVPSVASAGTRTICFNDPRTRILAEAVRCGLSSVAVTSTSPTDVSAV